ncbi:hypothetical protein [Immundisolibacter sp.]|uniref:hypothetical protein n=1 Tax=Immundisolibacter sp. TaxID=1934948 RepID=UPI003569D8D6
MLKAFCRYGALLLGCCGVVAPAAVHGGPVDDALLPAVAQYHSFGRGRSPFDAVVSEDGKVLVLGRGGLLAVLSEDLRGVARKLEVDPAVNFLAGAVGPDRHVRLTDGEGRIWRVNEALTEVSLESSEPAGALFSIQYLTDGTGLAVGEFGTVLARAPGAQHWRPQTFDWAAALPRLAEEFGDVSPHLYRVCRAPAGGALVVGEYGVVLELAQGDWKVRQVGDEYGTLFSCLVAPDGRQVVAGQSGRLLVSDGARQAWRRMDSGLTADIYDLTRYAGELLVVAQDRLAHGSLDAPALTVVDAALPSVSWVVRALPIREQLFLVGQQGYLVVDSARRLVSGSADGRLRTTLHHTSR